MSDFAFAIVIKNIINGWLFTGIQESIDRPRHGGCHSRLDPALLATSARTAGALISRKEQPWLISPTTGSAVYYAAAAYMMDVCVAAGRANDLWFMRPRGVADFWLFGDCHDRRHRWDLESAVSEFCRFPGMFWAWMVSSGFFFSPLFHWLEYCIKVVAKVYAQKKLNSITVIC